MSDSWEYGEATVLAAGAAPFPWPPAEEEPVLPAFGLTWKRATFEPAAFFRLLPRDRGTGAALVYYLSIVFLVAGANLFWESLSLFAGAGQGGELASRLGIEAISPITTFLLTPALLLAILFVAAGMAHALLRVLGDGQHGFGTTVRTFCYAYSPGLFAVVPLIGGPVGSIWMVVLLIIGLREAHGTEGWKPAVAILLPFALLIGLMMFAFLMLVAAGAAVMGGWG